MDKQEQVKGTYLTEGGLFILYTVPFDLSRLQPYTTYCPSSRLRSLFTRV